jgi:transcriptional regulator with XRE-family HTH domain
MAAGKRAKEPFELTIGESLDAVELGQWLKSIREEVGPTQFALAETLGAPYQNLSRLERGRGKREPMLTTLSKYLRALGWELALVARPRKARKG